MIVHSESRNTDMIIFKRVYVIKFVTKEGEEGCCTMRGRKDGHDMLVEFNRLYTTRVVDIKRVD